MPKPKSLYDKVVSPSVYCLSLWLSVSMSPPHPPSLHETHTCRCCFILYTYIYVCVCVCVNIPHGCLHIIQYAHTHIHTHLDACLHAAYKNKLHIHTYMHACTHIYTCNHVSVHLSSIPPFFDKHRKNAGLCYDQCCQPVVKHTSSPCQNV